MAATITRRGLLSAAFASRAMTAVVVPSQRVRYADPATELEVFRVTDPANASFLPPAVNRIFNRRSGLLVYASERGGSTQAYALDLKTWQSRELTEASALDVSTLHLTPDDRNLVFADAGAIRMLPVSGGGAREVYRLAGTNPPGSGLSITADGPSALVAEEGTRLRMIPLAGKGAAARTIAENKDGVSRPLARPLRAAAAYRSGDGWWLAHFDGQRNFRLKTAPGGVGPAQWSPDGRTLLYLSYPEDKARSYQLREINPDTGEDKLLASTSQYVAFSANGDATVFVGASASKANPYVLLMVRAVRRELALCEHKAADPAAVAPVFTPNSSKIFFQSDRHGKPAIYTMTVDWLVERTVDEADGENERDRPPSKSPMRRR